uniref:AP3A hydrolase n=1 Tax=Romanomermis culicivorax TaxID=13658 RepID=A0A915KI24_ROMCU
MIVRIILLAFHTSLSLSGAPLVLLVSLDGLRYDFVDEHSTPNIWRLGVQGVYAPLGLKSQVMTVTTSNHHCIATGLYQESHGIVDNVFYDPLFAEFYDNWNFTQNDTRAKNRPQIQHFWALVAEQVTLAGILIFS